MPRKTTKPIYRTVRIGEAAELLGVSVDTLRRWTAAGRLGVVNVIAPEARNSARRLEKIRQRQFSPADTLQEEQWFGQVGLRRHQRVFDEDGDDHLPSLEGRGDL